MKTVFLLAATFIVFLSIQIFAEEQTTYPDEQSEMREMNELQDSEILAYLIVINEGEIAAAQEAIQKNVNPKIRKFAQHLIEDHTKNLEATQEIAEEIDLRAQDTPTIARQRDNAAGIRANLAQLQDGAFATAFIDYMVRNHNRALQIIDEHLMKDVENVKLQDHLKATRIIVAQHYSVAEEIKDDLDDTTPKP